VRSLIFLTRINLTVLASTVVK